MKKKVMSLINRYRYIRKFILRQRSVSIRLRLQGKCGGGGRSGVVEDVKGIL